MNLFLGPILLQPRLLFMPLSSLNDIAVFSSNAEQPQATLLDQTFLIIGIRLAFSYVVIVVYISFTLEHEF